MMKVLGLLKLVSYGSQSGSNYNSIISPVWAAQCKMFL